MVRSNKWREYQASKNQKDTIIAEQEAKSQLEESDQNRDLKRLIDQLPFIDQQVIHLCYLEELSLNDIANVLNIPQGTVKSRLNRARKSLKKLYEQN